MLISHYIELAEKHSKNCINPSAVFCLEEAKNRLVDGSILLAASWCKKSLAYSVGCFHPDYKSIHSWLSCDIE